MKRLLALLLLVPAIARAESPPSAWDRSRDPQVAEEYELHRMVQQRLHQPTIAGIDLGRKKQVLEMLKHYGAEKSKNPLLRFDLAQAYFETEDHPRAAEVLKSAIAEFPDHPAADNAWVLLAFACGHIGDHICERNAYREVLRRETEDPARATPMLNYAETLMHLGELKDSIEAYRETIRIAERLPPGIKPETRPLATWGLAVALDRSGDRIAAEHEARQAVERSGRSYALLHDPGVFFVPDYEVNWYEGLGWAARARTAASARDAVTLWCEAERSFSVYVNGAESAKTPDRWLAIAKSRLADAKAQCARVQRSAPREPPRTNERDVHL
jgi:tetratricopeptide (TPR) repeat protein